MNKKILIFLAISAIGFSGCSSWNPFPQKTKCVTITCDQNFAKVAAERENNRYVSSDGRVGYEEGIYQVDDKKLDVGVWYSKK